MKILSCLIVILVVAWSYDAYAYLDPGTGSYVLQVAIAGIISALFILRIFWRRVVVFFSSLFKGKK